MGWTPKRTDSSAQGSVAGNPSPAPRRRKRAPLSEPEAQPARPRGGKNNSAGYGYDDRPRNQYVQLGKRWSAIVTDIKAGEYTWSEFVEGLDPEELGRGQLKSDNGTFQGRPPKMVPREFHLACQRELKRRFELMFSDQVLAVTEQYLKMAQKGNIKDETRAKMLQYAMERVFGGIPKDVTIHQEQPWEQMIINVTSDDGETGLPDHLKRRYAGYAERQGASGEETDD